MRRTLALILCLLATSVMANDNWGRFTDNARSVGNTSYTYTFNFDAMEVTVTNAGSQSCYVNHKTGDATTSHPILRAGYQMYMRYPGDDRNRGGGFSNVKVICPSTSTVDVLAISPAR